MHKVKVVKIKNTKKHPNADRLCIGTADGFQVITAAGTEDGTFGLFIPEGSQISHSFATKLGVTKEQGGMLDGSCRIRAIRLRGEASEGLWVALDHISDSVLCQELYDLSLNQIEAFDTIGGEVVCWRYESPAQKVKRIKQTQNKTTNRLVVDLVKHHKTGHLVNCVDALGRLNCGRLIWTEKIHGTSGRTGRVLCDKPLGRFSKLWNRVSPKFLCIRPSREYRVVTGTRNTIISESSGKDNYRYRIHEQIAPYLRNGETWYYEIAGYQDSGKPIMATHHIKKDAKKLLGPDLSKKLKDELAFPGTNSEIRYHYGCSPSNPSNTPNTNQFKVFVYRMTQCSEFGDAHELTYEQIGERFDSLYDSGFDPDFKILLVPCLEQRDLPMGTDEIKKISDELNCDSSCVANHQIREGVVLRVDLADQKFKCMKHKSLAFKVLEGILRNNNNFVDEEELA